MPHKPLSSEDLIPDEPLDRMALGSPISNELDSLNHRATAQRVAELAISARGHMNIALFGPWGSGKSSFFGLVSDQIRGFDGNVLPIRFDAWKNAGRSFQTNFLSSIAKDIPGADKGIAARLFTTSSSVALPFGIGLVEKGSRRRTIWAAALLIAGIFGVAPALWSLLLVWLDPTEQYAPLLAANMSGWVGFAASGTLLFVLLTLVLELSKVTVQESTPSHVSQFGALFAELMNSAKSKRYVIFIDELDRCSPADVIQTLEGLRTFLGHERCVFVVAFDREAVSATIAQNLPNNVPARPSRPYYSTSGEYLDKIFQFQIALPPQPSHTFRRFALSLVKDRGGLWAELSSKGVSALDRVVRILSPMHVTSPRRTKVLLNDFAMNVRILERLDFDWLDRAEEIAALTVLQTEFPNFASDLEEQPQLLKFVAGKRKPAREPLAGLYDAYVAGSNAALDGIVRSKTDSDDTEDTDDGDDTDDTDEVAHSTETGTVAAPTAVALQLNRNLHRFLRKVDDMGVTLPMPDLILMHSDSNLLRFEDLNVYNSLLAAADEPRADTLEILVAATEADQQGALAYLLEQAELESADEAENLVILAGDLANGLTTSQLLGAADAMHDAWKHVAGANPDIVARFSTASISGYVKALSAVLEPAQLQGVHASIRSKKPDDQAAALLATIESIPDLRFLDHSYLGSRVMGLGLTAPNVVTSYLNAIDRLNAPAMDQKVGDILASAFNIEEPEEIVAPTATAAAIARATEENESARAVYAESLELAKTSLREIANAMASLKVEGSTRGSVLRVMRTIGKKQAWALGIHDDAIDLIRERGQESFANEELLTASIDAGTIRVRDAIVPRLSLKASVAGSVLATAISRQLRIAANVKTSTAFRETAASNALAMAKLTHDTTVDVRDLVEELNAALAEGWDPATAEERFTLSLAVADALGNLEDFGMAQAEVVRSSAFGHAANVVDESVPYEFLVTFVGEQEPENAAKLVSELETEITDSTDERHLPLVRIVLAAQKRMGEARMVVSPIDGHNIEHALAKGLSGEELATWLSTGPTFDQIVESELDMSTVPAQAWETYSRAASEADRQLAWSSLASADADVAQLRAVASEGISREFYGIVAATVDSSTTAPVKAKAVSHFRTLPAGSAFAREASGIAKRLVRDGEGHKGDAPLVAALLLDSASHTRKAHRQEFIPTLSPWLEAAQSYVAKRDVKQLRDLGYLQGEETLIEKIGRAITGRSKEK